MGKYDEKMFQTIMDALEVVHAENVFIITEHLAQMGVDEKTRNEFKAKWNSHFDNIRKDWWKDAKEK